MIKKCIFCKIANKTIPAEVIFEDDYVLAFKDINPKAPVHVLIIPKNHIETVDNLKPKDEKIVGAMVYAAQKIARDTKIAKNGYRLVFNVKSHGGQIIDHIHLHLLGGQKLGGMV